MGNKTIGKRIKILREKNNLTQAELAKKLFVKRETVNYWENGTRDLKSQSIIQLAELFNVSCDYILRDIQNIECFQTDIKIMLLTIENETLKATINKIKELVNKGGK